MKPGCSQDSSQKNGGGGRWWHTEEDPEGISYSSSQPEDKDGFLKFIVPHTPNPLHSYGTIFRARDLGCKVQTPAMRKGSTLLARNLKSPTHLIGISLCPTSIQGPLTVDPN